MHPSGPTIDRISGQPPCTWRPRRARESSRAEHGAPKLNDAPLQRIARYGERRHALSGEILYEQGTSALGIHVVLDGAIEIVRPGILGDELITVLYAGEFTGEVNVLAGRRSLVRAGMIEEGHVLVIGPHGLRRLIQEDPEVSEVLMRAFILRRVVLIARGSGDATLIGSAHSSGTLRGAGLAEPRLSARAPFACSSYIERWPSELW